MYGSSVDKSNHVFCRHRASSVSDLWREMREGSSLVEQIAMILAMTVLTLRIFINIPVVINV